MAVFPAGYFPPGYFPPGYFPEGTSGPPRPPPYVPASVTGWRSTARRKGPDPQSARVARRGGLGS